MKELLLQRQLVAVLDLGHGDLVGMLDEASGDIEQQFLHDLPSAL